VEFYKSQNYSDRNKSVINTGARDGGGNDKFFCWVEMFYIMVMMVVTELHIFVKSQQTVHSIP
jgi:hypothetical protein